MFKNVRYTHFVLLIDNSTKKKISRTRTVPYLFNKRAGTFKTVPPQSGPPCRRINKKSTQFPSRSCPTLTTMP